MHRRPSPATALAGLALFFALGGSAFAVSHAVKPQPRCATGAVRGIAAVTGDPSKGMANIPDQFSSAKVLFSRTYNCGTGAPQVRRVSTGVYEVRFPGNTATTGVASASNAFAWVQPLGGSVFRVGVHPPGLHDPAEMAFVLVLF
jgi:hypothetical protein